MDLEHPLANCCNGLHSVGRTLNSHASSSYLSYASWMWTLSAIRSLADCQAKFQQTSFKLPSSKTFMASVILKVTSRSRSDTDVGTIQENSRHIHGAKNSTGRGHDQRCFFKSAFDFCEIPNTVLVDPNRKLRQKAYSMKIEGRTEVPK